MRSSLPIVLVAGLIAPLAAEARPVRGPAMLIHGNYCGPGNNGPLPPVDALDAACARHDACTPDGGLAPRACNLRLQRDAQMVARDRRQSDDLRAMAGLVAAGASLIMSDMSGESRSAAIPVSPTDSAQPLVHRSAIAPAPDLEPDETEE